MDTLLALYGIKAFNIRFFLEEGEWAAEIVEFPGCIAQGDTFEETFEMIQEAAESWLATAVELGWKYSKN